MHFAQCKEQNPKLHTEGLCLYSNLEKVTMQTGPKNSQSQEQGLKEETDKKRAAQWNVQGNTMFTHGGRQIHGSVFVKTHKNIFTLWKQTSINSQ